MQVVYKRPASLTDAYFKYCPGCGHSIINKLIAEVIDEQNLVDKAIMVLPIGCAVYADQYFDVDVICALHGRAPAVATGIKRSLPQNHVIVYQGDGDMVAEGMSEIIHAAIRGERLSVIFVNNAIFGMTGGQMAPTTLLGQRTTTSPYGRKEAESGAPINMAEFISNIKGCIYSERVAVNSPKNIISAKRSLQRAFRYQAEGKGLSFVEILSQCPTGWKLSPLESLDWVAKELLSVYPLGVFKRPEVTNA
jgi:2-oxoglutarate ferredoxin oxidoreductase subunit beta